MNIIGSSNEGLSVRIDPDDGRFWLVLRDLGVNPQNVSHFIVTFHREPLTEEELHDNIERPRHALCDADEPELPF